MGSMDGNGGHDLGDLGALGPSPNGASSVPDVVRHANGDAPGLERDSGSSLDPGRIGRLVEREVAIVLDAARAEADRIGSRALVIVRRAEAKIAALQLELDSAVAELRGLADRAEGEPPRVEPPGTAEPATPVGIPAVLTEPPAAMQRTSNAEPQTLDIPASNEVGRLLREHLS